MGEAQGTAWLLTLLTTSPFAGPVLEELRGEINPDVPFQKDLVGC